MLLVLIKDLKDTPASVFSQIRDIFSISITGHHSINIKPFGMIVQQEAQLKSFTQILFHGNIQADASKTFINLL